MAKRDARVVWSSTDGDLRRARDPQLKARLAAGGRVKVRREVAGRRGKPVTTVADVPLDDAALRQLLARLLVPVEPRGLSSLLGRFGVSPPQRVPKRDGEDHRAAG
jgi:hypothetical protein